jgi:hypothetical protein
MFYDFYYEIQLKMAMKLPTYTLVTPINKFYFYPYPGILGQDYGFYQSIAKLNYFLPSQLFSIFLLTKFLRSC